MKKGKLSGTIACMWKIEASVLLKLFINGNERSTKFKKEDIGQTTTSVFCYFSRCWGWDLTLLLLWFYRHNRCFMKSSYLPLKRLERSSHIKKHSAYWLLAFEQKQADDCWQNDSDCVCVCVLVRCVWNVDWVYMNWQWYVLHLWVTFCRAFLIFISSTR